MSALFSKENFNKIGEYIYRKSGIALTEEKHFVKIEKIFQRRCDELGVANFRKYFFILRFEDANGHEFQELMNAVTANETYFFREQYQFETLINVVLPQLHRTKAMDKPIRILTAPSSSGEETYTIGIYLLEQLTMIEERDFEIVGIDIDSTIIDKARLGIYTERSIHAIPPTTKTKYFTKKG
jgi:chemotaxis protein methyltransferase CheR